SVVAHCRAQPIQHRVIDAYLGQILLDGHHTLFPPDHVAGDVLVVQPTFELHDHLPSLRLGLSKEVLSVLDEQRVDVDDVALDLEIVGASPQLHQGAGNDVDKAPGKFTEGGAIALAGELASNARGDLRDTS